MTRQETIQQGLQARRLLDEEPIFQDAVQRVRDELYKQFQDNDLTDEQIIEIYRYNQTLDNILKMLRGIDVDGKREEAAEQRERDELEREQNGRTR